MMSQCNLYLHFTTLHDMGGLIVTGTAPRSVNYK